MTIKELIELLQKFESSDSVTLVDRYLVVRGARVVSYVDVKRSHIENHPTTIEYKEVQNVHQYVRQ